MYPTILPNEKLLIVTREHWILLTLKLVVWAFFASIPKLIELLSAIIFKFDLVSNFGPWWIYLKLAYSLATLLGLLMIIVLYYLNVHIVTTQRVMDQDQLSLLRHVFSELNLENVEDVTSETIGILGNLFNFGTVYIQTAGAKERFEFNNIPRANAVAQYISRLRAQTK